MVRGLALVGIAGLLLFVFSPHPPLAFAGALLWGMGVSLGFPVGMSAGADDPVRAAGRVSVIASIGYCAFLAGALAGHNLSSASTVSPPTATAVASGAARATTRPPAERCRRR